MREITKRVRQTGETLKEWSRRHGFCPGYVAQIACGTCADIGRAREIRETLEKEGLWAVSDDAHS